MLCMWTTLLAEKWIYENTNEIQTTNAAHLNFSQSKGYLKRNMHSR